MIYLILSVVSGLLTGLSFNLPYLGFVIWFSLAPFLYAINKSSSRKAFFHGLLFGLAYYGAAIFWVANVSRLGFSFLIIYLSLYWALFAYSSKYFLKRPAMIFTLSCLWVLFEFLKESIWCGFGWANLGYSQYRNLYLIQSADLLGVKFISFLIVMVNVFVFEFIAKKRVLKPAVYVMIIFILCFSYSFYRLDRLEDSGSVKISIVQPNIAQELKWKKEASPFIIDRLRILSKEADYGSLVIFPENSWPHILTKENFSELKDFIKNIERETLIGGIVKQGREFYNTALLFDKNGNLEEYYYKIRLVPFGEYVPARKAFKFISIINEIGDISRGRKITKFSYKDKKFSVLICFEDIFPKHVVRFTKGNDFLINITNDAWFGGEPEASQHLGIMTMRAVENRISIVRSSNTGISGWVSFRGKINKLKNHNKEVFFAAAAPFEVSLNRDRSFYNKYSDGFVLFCSLFLLSIFTGDKYYRRWGNHEART